MDLQHDSTAYSWRQQHYPGINVKNSLHCNIGISTAIWQKNLNYVFQLIREFFLQ